MRNKDGDIVMSHTILINLRRRVETKARLSGFKFWMKTGEILGLDQFVEYTGIQLMVGLPGDNYERDIETVRETIKLGPEMVRIYPTLVIAGTELERRWEQGTYQALQLEEAIAICKAMLLLFSAANIPVIRMGLYPGEELRRDGVITAGPFHPAFRELVEQAIFKEQTEMAIHHYIHKFGPCTHLVIHINERDLSKMLGPQRRNLAHLSQIFPLFRFHVKIQLGYQRDWVGISQADNDSEALVLSRQEFVNQFLAAMDKPDQI